MDEYYLYFYFCWLLFVMCFFFMRLSIVRRSILIIILILITVSPYVITIYSVKVSATFIILLILALALFGVSVLHIYECMVTFICMISYVALLLWEKTVPILFFMPSIIIVSFIIVGIISILVSSFSDKVVIVIIGLTLGQLIYEVILIEYHLQQSIGGIHYINYLLITLLFVIVYEFIKKCVMSTIRFTKSLN